MLKDECSVTKFHLFRGTFLNAHRDSSRKLGRRPISAKKDTFLNKKGTKNITTSYLIPFLSVLHQNKALYNFHKKRQHPTEKVQTRAWWSSLESHTQSPFCSKIQPLQYGFGELKRILNTLRLSAVELAKAWTIFETDEVTGKVCQSLFFERHSQVIFQIFLVIAQKGA